MATNLKVGKTIKALANLTTPFTPQTPFAPWGVSPQAERLRKKSCNAQNNISKKFVYLHRKKRKGAGVVERAALEMR